MKSIIFNLLASFTNDHGGYSARKLSAFFGVILSAYVTIKHAGSENTVELVLSWLGFALLCLGIVTVQQIIDFKNGKKNEDPKP